jgi:hypothetical protein
MSRTIANVATSSDTFGSWIGVTNQIATAFKETVTVKANTAGDMSTGNGFVTGVFGANTITASIVRGGNVTSSANLSIASNAEFGNSSAQISFTMNAIGQIKTTSYTTTNTDAQILDTVDVTEHRTCKYLISVKNTNNNEYQSTEIMLLQDGTGAYITEYATLISGSTLAQFSANINSGSVRLYVTPSLADNVIKFQRTSLAV